jgi:hypothetical protein
MLGFEEKTILEMLLEEQNSAPDGKEDFYSLVTRGQVMQTMKPTPANTPLQPSQNLTIAPIIPQTQEKQILIESEKPQRPAIPTPKLSDIHTNHPQAQFQISNPTPQTQEGSKQGITTPREFPFKQEALALGLAALVTVVRLGCGKLVEIDEADTFSELKTTETYFRKNQKDLRETDVAEIVTNPKPVEARFVSATEEINKGINTLTELKKRHFKIHPQVAKIILEPIEKAQDQIPKGKKIDFIKKTCDKTKKYVGGSFDSVGKYGITVGAAKESCNALAGITDFSDHLGSMKEAVNDLVDKNLTTPTSNPIVSEKFGIVISKDK